MCVCLGCTYPTAHHTGEGCADEERDQSGETRTSRPDRRHAEWIMRAHITGACACAQMRDVCGTAACGISHRQRTHLILTRRPLSQPAFSHLPLPRIHPDLLRT